ncbi:Hypothetical protein, putative [Bodo saltans]|uniref:Uncharacterized protein n=1 Tax=Bodo saltans TaxID=75058 RepID=A0A0S4J0V8_BODSA|nr:Hypothetical protein, putative [Bodo saltans]|eukprot:CUG40469.1 Hypothetical protein, putative [Bodo saltans]
MLSVKELLEQTLRGHESRIDALLREEAAVLARCELLQELILAAHPTTHHNVGAHALTTEGKSKSSAEPYSTISPRASSIITTANVKEEGIGGRKRDREGDVSNNVSVLDKRITAASPQTSPQSVLPGRSDRIQVKEHTPLRPVAVSPRSALFPVEIARGGLAAAYPPPSATKGGGSAGVIVDEDDHPSEENPLCTPSEILDECELLFGGNGTASSAQLVGGGGVVVTTAHEASKSLQGVASTRRPVLAGASSSSLAAAAVTVADGAKGALRAAALKKERHPRVLVAPPGGSKKRSVPLEAAVPHHVGGPYTLNRLHDMEDDDVEVERKDGQQQPSEEPFEPKQTPDAFWDVSM